MNINIDDIASHLCPDEVLTAMSNALAEAEPAKDIHNEIGALLTSGNNSTLYVVCAGLNEEVSAHDKRLVSLILDRDFKCGELAGLLSAALDNIQEFEIARIDNACNEILVSLQSGKFPTLELLLISKCTELYSTRINSCKERAHDESMREARSIAEAS